MFTGIIETLGTVVSIEKIQTNLRLGIRSDITNALKIDQSVAHNGVCLTVVAIEGDIYYLDAIQETLDKTNLSTLEVGSIVNLERCMTANGRFDGHVVQGHVDQTGTCTKVETLDGSWKYHISYDPSKGNVTVDKGSICLNGISLTVVDSTEGAFSVAIIPYTYENTSLHTTKVGDSMNLEFDVIGKYVKRMLTGYKQ